MPIDLNYSLNTVSDQAFGNNLISNTLGSILSCALILSIISILLIMFIYPAKSGTSLVTVVKIFIYMFAACAAVLFVHDGIQRRRWREEEEQRDLQDLNPNNRDFMHQAEQRDVQPTQQPPETVQQIIIQAPAQPVAPQLPRIATDRITGGGDQRRLLNSRVPPQAGNPYDYSRQ
jgi:hypothetical protein